ncbi:MAG: hypothetical protein HC817_04585 [Saprospiraceae bacterium]|nr:hypothetical protein [Saprospiraceae bacterium]
MAKVKKPLLPPRNFDPSVFNKPDVALPTPETVTTAAAFLTGKSIDASKVETVETVEPLVSADLMIEETPIEPQPTTTKQKSKEQKGQTNLKKDAQKDAQKDIRRENKASAEVKNAPKSGKVSKVEKVEKVEKENTDSLNDKTNRVGITALIDRTLLKKVKIYALEEGVSMSDVCNWALSDYLVKKNNHLSRCIAINLIS